jgi:hypothetical protein
MPAGPQEVCYHPIKRAGKAVQMHMLTFYTEYKALYHEGKADESFYVCASRSY